MNHIRTDVILEMRDVGKVFDTEDHHLQALQAVNLTVKDGEFISLLGPSGCGKTTLLNIISGLLPASTGEVRFRNQKHDRPRRDLGVMFQSPVLLPWRTVEKNILLPVEILGLDKQQDIGSRIRKLLELVGLAGFEDRYPSQLSGGMAQRVALCRLLTFDPDVLLMDEPFGALDEFTRETLDMELLRVWAATMKTVVFVTHNIAEAVLLSDRVVVMSPRPGRITEIVVPELVRPRIPEMLGSEPLIRCVQHIRKILGVGSFSENEVQSALSPALGRAMK